MDFCCKRLHFLTALCFFCCCFCLFIHEIFTAYNSNSSFPSGTKLQLNIEAANNNYLNIEKNKMWETAEGRSMMARRVLGGPGSSPPRCTSKCGRCMPCQPVHVAVPPGTRVTMEYYPEAWRCKCGNKLYTP